MNKSVLQRVYNYPIYSRNLKMYSNKGFGNKDKGSQGGTHWNCFHKKDNKSYYFDSFGGQPHNFLLNKLPKPIINHNYKNQDIKSLLNYVAHIVCTSSI